MWVIGDWGQSDPWTRASGVQMTKGEDGLYTGVLTLPKGTRFDLKILKNPAAGTLIWSATRYASVLNSDGVYDFGEFVDNLVPNGNFEEGVAKWTPPESIIERDYAHEGGHCLVVGDRFSNSVSSDMFVIPPNQALRYSTYIRTWTANRLARVVIKDVGTQSVLFESLLKPQSANQWIAVSGTFKSGSSPVMAQVVCTSVDKVGSIFDSMSIVSP
ncbi:hypothetical protein BP677P4_00015 [Bifidobacterium phage BP677P4]|nr:hypothetical protein BP677P4_00015 [Bifidobacterium phage BP677P4]